MDIESLYRIYQDHPGVQTDTRKLQAGDLYFALKGERFDGNQFAASALEAGAAYAIIDDATQQTDEKTLLVDDVLETLQQLALHHRRQFSIPFIGITGSNGKTTTKELMHAVLSRKFRTVATAGNLNNHIGVPLTLLRMPRDTEMAIIEMGANHIGEIASYCRIAEPGYGLINNCGKAHLEGFGSLEGVKKAKGELYDHIRNNGGTIFRNADLDYLEELSRGIEKQVTYGSSVADVQGKIYRDGPLLEVALISAGKEMLIRSRLVGSYNFPNILGAVAAGLHFGVALNDIRAAIEEYTPGNSRSQLIRQDGRTIVLDAYNANPSSMQAAIQNFALAAWPNKTLMLGAMMELGPDSVEEHQKLVDQLEQSNWNHVVLVGGDFKKTRHHYLYFDDTTQAGEWYRKQQWEDMALLIKGSRAIAMEKVLEQP